MTYILKDGTSVESIPLGRCTSFKIGQIQKNGFLQVCDRGPNCPGGRKPRVICKCTRCGKYTLISAQEFVSEGTKSCGCYMPEASRARCANVGKKSNYKDYTQIENPFYIFLRRTDEVKAGMGAYWEVQCKKCQRIYKVIPSQIVSEKRPKGNNPCDCWKKISKGVFFIEDILQKNKKNYIKEKTFDSCLSPLGNFLKFDFYVDNRYLIEFDGEQHFLPEKFNSSVDGIGKLAKQQEYDIIKNNWCLENNIPLIRIPYTHKNIVIEDLIPESSQFLVKKGE